MKLSDYVASFLADAGIRHVFGITGGASLHLIHGVNDRADMRMVFPHHEQAAAMAADAYARLTGLGAAIATSGPGATNLLTGICCAYYDSVPVLFLTGQVASFRRKGTTGVRQLGFQETDTLDICRSVTKYCATIEDPLRIRYELEKAKYLATEGRPGPVLIDIPDDLQRASVDPATLERFTPPARSANGNLAGTVDRCVEAMMRASRPVFVIGWGVRLARAEDELRGLLNRVGFPVLPTWAAKDMFAEDDPQLAGTFGTHGTRAGNFAVQNADLLISIGSRLDTHETGSPPGSFARGARKVVVDIDEAELRKFQSNGIHIDVPVCMDAKEFIVALGERVGKTVLPDITSWKRRVQSWRSQYPAAALAAPSATAAIDPYAFVAALSRAASADDIIVSDTGCALAWMMQSFGFRGQQRFFHAFNNTPMGYALPASIGAAFAGGGRRAICVAGDGSFQMNIQELATLLHHQLDVKIFVINNQGYSMIQQTQDQWLGSRYVGSSREGGMTMPDFAKVAEGFGIRAISVGRQADVERAVRETLGHRGPTLCDVAVPSACRVIPQVKFGRPIEDSEPLLPREEFRDNMIVAPLPVSATLG